MLKPTKEGVIIRMNNELELELKRRSKQFDTALADTLKRLEDMIQVIVPGRYSTAALEITPLTIQLIVDDVTRFRSSFEKEDLADKDVFLSHFLNKRPTRRDLSKDAMRRVRHKDKSDGTRGVPARRPTKRSRG
jgi:hypothetical protein